MEKPPRLTPPGDVQAVKAEPVLEDSFTFEMGVAWNRHHEFGGDGKRLYSTVTLLLYQGGTARIEDGGKLELSHLDNTYGYEATTTWWSNVWTGTWEDGEGKLAMDLALVGRECEMVISGLEGTPVKQQECQKAPKTIRLQCETGTITLDPVLVDLAESEPAPEAGGARKTVDAWVCTPSGDVNDLGGTPVAWVFGKDSCIEATSSPTSSRLYGPCRDDDPI